MGVTTHFKRLAPEAMSGIGARRGFSYITSVKTNGTTPNAGESRV